MRATPRPPIPRPSPDIRSLQPIAGGAGAPATQDRQSIFVLAILGLLMGFASISTDVYLPALPVMAKALGSNDGAMAWTISGYLIGFSLGQLLWGPIGDRYGRRPPIAMGLGLFVIGSAGCALSASAWAIIGWRVAQAAGACAGVVLARAMVRDLYAGQRAAQMLSTLMTVMAIAPLLGPLIGGQILLHASWRAIFWVLVVVGVATMMALFALPETLPPGQRNREPLRLALAAYGQLVRQRQLMGYAGAIGFYYVAAYAYIAGSPFAYIEIYHVRPQSYGLLFGAGIIGIIVANLLNARLVTWLGGVRLLRWGTLVAASAGAVLAIDALTGWGGLAGLALPLLAVTGMNGLIAANAIAGAMSHFPERAGAVSALVGAIQYGSGIIGSALVGACADGTARPLGWVIGSSCVGALACAWLIVTPGASPGGGGSS